MCVFGFKAVVVCVFIIRSVRDVFVRPRDVGTLTGLSIEIYAVTSVELNE